MKFTKSLKHLYHLEAHNEEEDLHFYVLNLQTYPRYIWRLDIFRGDSKLPFFRGHFKSLEEILSGCETEVSDDA